MSDRYVTKAFYTRHGQPPREFVRDTAQEAKELATFIYNDLTVREVKVYREYTSRDEVFSLEKPNKA